MLYELLVAIHDPHVVFFVDVFLHLKAFFKRMHRVFEIFPLVFILFLYVRVDFNILSALVLNILVQVIIDSALQLVIIIDVLDHSVYRILHAIDNSIVSMDCVSCSFDVLLKGFLSGSQVIDHKPEVCI